MDIQIILSPDLKEKLEREAQARGMTLADFVRESLEDVVARKREADELAALDYFQKYADQSVSFTDCVSFVLMEKYRIPTAFSFDRHFTIAGFDVEPS